MVPPYAVFSRTAASRAGRFLRHVLKVYFPSPILARLILLGSLVLLAGFRPAAALAAGPDEVDCADLSMTFRGSGYDRTCETGSMAFADTDGSALYQRLEANAEDSSHFLVVMLLSVQGRAIYTGVSLRTNLTDFYDGLRIDTWHDGHAVKALSTAEFDSDLRGLPSHCLAFQKLAHRDQGGYRKVMVGFACSQDDIKQAYQALDELDLPD